MNDAFKELRFVANRMNLVYDQDGFDANISNIKDLVNKQDDSFAQSCAFQSILALLKVQYDDDKYVFDLLELQSKCKINEALYISTDMTKINSLVTAINTNKSKGINSNSVTVTMTSCKRLNLFVPTVNSFLACCTDLSDFVYEWIVVDDNSSEADREFMKITYPFITFVFKSPDQKGHAQSMNIIRDLVKTPWVFHLEDDWQFYVPGNFITRCLEVLADHPDYGQCLLNRGYGEDQVYLRSIGGGYRRYTPKGLRYYIHEYAMGNALKIIDQKIASYNQVSCSYWPHYSLRVGITRKSVFDIIGPFDETAKHFEREYAYRYRTRFLTTYLDNVVCTHIGRKTYERDDVSKINAYNLNNEKQFGIDRKITSDNVVKSNSSIGQQPHPQLMIKTYVLNLKRRQDRLDKFATLARNELPFFHRFEAIDGMSLVPCHLIQKLFEPNDYNYRRGLVGCAITHLTTWIELASSTVLHGMLITEDDATFRDNFIPKFMDLITTYNEADIIFLGHNAYPHAVRTSDLTNNAKPMAEQWSKARSIKDSMGGAFAYWITKRGATNMLHWIEQRGFHYGVDWEMFHNDSNKVYYASPFLAFAECFQSGGKAIDTDIQKVYDGVGYKNSYEWLQKELEYWGEKAVRNHLPGMICAQSNESKICCYPDKCSKQELLSGICIFHRTKEISAWLNQFPVHWYETGKWTFSIPDNKLTDKDIKSVCFYNYLNIDSVRGLATVFSDSK